ncbi:MULTISPECIES: phage major capsid protein [Mycobacterium]|uniref:Phage major capsid protein, HK97 family n=1 Tax=Mycobacterium intracellulare 1956 TaxID=1299331 RepID=X8CJF4_MYCIT|nr:MULTISPECIES: phage major capsid protein [Mycobacterium]EUA31998.1 phage major capsid protein, HK97 family [Mycobacterium intracellulare]EUA55385.1 phage major capsid protein, HK97 family [Mycobacterium intracellulare 1956]UQB90881.1 phage major capsid protein [Mycobacterium intracellulare]WSE48428.1 phage major capsid protein [Mycobacterium sp. 3-98]
MTVNPFATTGSAKAFHPDAVGVEPQDVIPEALILNITTQAGVVVGDEPVVRVPRVSFEDAPGFVPEGDAIEESDPDDSESLIATGAIALLTTATEDQLAQGQASALLNSAVRRAMVRKANRALLSQPAPTSPDIIPPPGVLVQSHRDGGVIGDSLDELIDAIALIEDDGGVATHILASPTAWADLQRLKTAEDSNVSLVGAGTTSATRQLLSLPVLVDRDVPAGTVAVLDRSAILAVWGALEVATSRDFHFNRRSVSIRAWWRFGAKVAHPNRVVSLGVGGS